MRTGIPIVISAASGTGKSTHCRRLLERLEGVQTSISYTTRAPRGAEQNGVHYHFVSDAEFTKMIDDNAFVEWATVFDKRYGTAESSIRAQLEAGQDVLLDIDVQGGLQLKARIPETLLIFLLPPSLGALRERLCRRGEDSEAAIQRRLSEAKTEIEAALQYDLAIVNDDLETAGQALESVIRAERIRRQDLRALLADCLAS